MALSFDSVLNFIAPKGKTKAGGAGVTPTFDPTSATGVLTLPNFQTHLTDVYATRLANDTRALIEYFFQYDPDLSAAVSAYLTLANTEPMIVARDVDGVIDRDATKSVYQLIKLLGTRVDMTLGFQWKPDLKAICADLRTMLLLRGSIMAEAVLDKTGIPSEIRLIDPITIEWREQGQAGNYKPWQDQKGKNDKVALDSPAIFYSTYRRNVTTMYTQSPFVSCLNIVAARQNVIQTLYRIMNVTGVPRLELKVLEEVMAKAVPESIKQDPNKIREWMNSRLQELASSFSTLRPDQVFVHWDSVEAGTLNSENPGLAIDITSVIDTLNAQCQAAMKTMATILGRGTSGVNTASVEARIAAMNADEINDPIEEMLGNIFTFYMVMSGFQGTVEFKFRPVEMRQELELEPQLIMRQSRLQTELSLGTIDDDTYHLLMFGHIRPDDAPELSGTGFMAPQTAGVDTSSVSPNSDPLGRSLTAPDSKSAKSKTVKKPKPKAK